MSEDIEVRTTRGYRLTKVGVEFVRPLTSAEFEELGRVLARIANATPWSVGDWLLEAASISEIGERYRLVEEITGERYEQLRNLERVSASYGHDQRHLAPWRFYAAALSLPENARMDALVLAKDQALTFEGFRSYVRRQRAAIGRDVRARGAATAVGRQVVKCPNCGWSSD